MVLLLLLLKILVGSARLGGNVTPSIPRPQHHTANTCKEEKEKILKGKNKEQIRLLKPASLTLYKIGTLRSFYEDTEMGTKLVWY